MSVLRVEEKVVENLAPVSHSTAMVGIVARDIKLIKNMFRQSEKFQQENEYRTIMKISFCPGSWQFPSNSNFTIYLV